MGNLVEIKKRDGRYVSFILGYDGLYRVAIIENASHSQLCEKLGTDIITSIPPSLTEAQIELLKSIPDIYLTTYTYKPHVGITSITDPSGRRVNYRYDDFGRLKAVIDERNNFTEDYDYNFNNQKK